ncbi:hypothetical protein [Actinosynnema mirum]|uniref:DUF916 domain-containing protein n=1 Tax=Actinosynnema mirum (strain ATCC 29888 / DSM 43827 / JCM 3225 / NBRC 14064 / NCIMB 13271 / NRRL B-12336 / IMRU 3971 / 101) TaxID=446462 RepID=C6WE46_ACTMD|nr:hypothetical protein [Actinosynnema mirum]ACU35789.1 hypothetical protein Amir_1841 [Actinosynnema mirum DSM 43827]
MRWSAGPTDGRVSLRHVAEPGSAVRDSITVRNLGQEPADFVVSAGDGVLGQNGAFDIAPGTPSDSGAWITVGGLDAGKLTLGAGEHRDLPVSVAVPADATPGDHPAGIVVGVSATEDGVRVQRRIGVRVHLQVTGELTPALEVRGVTTDFTPSWVPFADGTLKVTYEVVNTGNVRLGAAATAEAAGPFGLLARRGGDAADELLPGNTTTRTLEIPAPSLFWASGDLTVTGVAVGEDELTAPTPIIRGYSVLAVSWTGVGLLVLVAGGAALFLVRRKRTGTGGVSTEEPVAAV